MNGFSTSACCRYRSGSAWGHRHFSLAALNNNAGSADSEGLLGFGTFQGSGGSYEVMNVADEKSTWDYTTSDNIYLWSEMVGGGNNVGNPPKDGAGGGRPRSTHSLRVRVRDRSLARL